MCVFVFCAVFPLFEGRISGQGVGISRVGEKKKQQRADAFLASVINMPIYSVKARMARL